MTEGHCSQPTASPGSYSGDRLGFWDRRCFAALAVQHGGDDASQLSALARREALSNLRANVHRLPVVLPARLGRMLALYRPSQTVDFVAEWMTLDTGLIWLWVGSFWVLLILGASGWVMARRRRVRTWPLVAPLVAAVVFSIATYGEPRYRTLADFGLLVLAGFAIDRLLPHRAGPVPGAEDAAPQLTGAAPVQ